MVFLHAVVGFTLYAIVLCVTVGVAGGVGFGAIAFKVKQVSHRNHEFVLYCIVLYILYCIVLNGMV